MRVELGGVSELDCYDSLRVGVRLSAFAKYLAWVWVHGDLKGKFDCQQGGYLSGVVF